METDVLSLPDELRAVPRAALEKYVVGRIRQFSRVFVSQLLGPSEASGLPVEAAYNQACQLLSASQQQSSNDTFVLRFTHACKFLGCMDKECQLCANNPNKRCRPNDNFDECYADNQVLKSKCDVDVFVQLLSETTGRLADMSGLEVQVSVIDGESTISGGTNKHDGFKELLRSDEGQALLGSHASGVKSDSCGRLLVKLQDGSSRLPDLFVADKTDTFHMDAHTYSSFRLMARAFQRDLYGNAVIMEHIAPAVSEKFIVKTQRALNDYRKSEYPHYKDELTKLKFIGSITAQRLRDIQAHVADVPFTSIETVEQLKHLMLYADQNRQVENKLLELLNMKGKHKHKWDYLREILMEKIVYDDMVHRAWYTDETMSQGLLFACKQGQVNLEKPFGVAQRVGQGAQVRLQVLSPTDSQSQEFIKLWRSMAEQAWCTPGHIGWTIVTEPLELVGSSGGIARPAQAAGQRPAGLSSRPSLTEAAQGLVKRESVLSPHHSMGYPAGTRSFHMQATSGSEGLGSFQHQGLHTTSSGGGLVEASNRPFQFTATRSPRVTAHERGSSGGNTPRSESGLPGLPTAFGNIGRLSLDQDLRTGQEKSQHPFGHFTSVFGGGQDLDPHSLRTSSSPDVFAQAVHSQPHSPTIMAKPSLGLDLSNSESPRLRGAGPSRIRRMSATDASTAQRLQAMQPLDRGMDLTTSLSMSKRPRASIPLEPVEQGQVLESVFDASLSSPMQSPSNVALYHQESRGRHHPRSRMSMADLELAPSMGDSQQSPGPQAQGSNGLDLDDILVESRVAHLSALADPTLVHLQAAAAAGGPHPHSPSHFLSSSMQHALQLDESQQQLQHQRQQLLQDQQQLGSLGTAASLGAFAVDDSWNQLASATAAAAVGPVDQQHSEMAFEAMNPEAVNPAGRRTLKHSDDDSFKRMLDVFPMPSPPHNPVDADQVMEAQAFAAFLDDNFNSPLPS